MLTADEYEDVNDQNNDRNNLNNKPVKLINWTVVPFCRSQTVEIVLKRLTRRKEDATREMTVMKTEGKAKRWREKRRKMHEAREKIATSSV